jgi:hypothetical protein
MLEDQAVGGYVPESADSSSLLKTPVYGTADLPAPDPGVADSARLRIAAQRVLTAGQPPDYAAARPIEDILSISAVVRSARADTARPADALDVGAALVVLCDLRLYLDGLEADLLDGAQQVGLSWDVIAAIIGIPADEARHRHRALRARQGPQ